MTAQYWFKPKQYGYGAVPMTWEGWAFTLFVALLIGLPILAQLTPGEALEIFDTFYRAGSLVLGGGHVVLPLLQASVVPAGWVTNEQFLAGYGATQAVPGPIFAFAAYLGAVSAVEPNGWLGAAWALIAVYVPAFLYVYAALPWWNTLRRNRWLASALPFLAACLRPGRPVLTFSSLESGSSLYFQCAATPYSARRCIAYVRSCISTGLPCGPITVVCSDWYMLNFGIAMKSLNRPGSGFHSEWMTPTAP